MKKLSLVLLLGLFLFVNCESEPKSSPQETTPQESVPELYATPPSERLEKYIENVFLKDQTKIDCVVNSHRKVAGIYFLSSSRLEPWSKHEFMIAALGIFSGISDSVWASLGIENCEIDLDVNEAGNYAISLEDCKYLGTLPPGALTEKIVFDKLKWID